MPGCATSSLIIVNVAVTGVPRIAPPVGFERVRVTVSLASKIASLTIGIVTVLLVSPFPKVIVIGVLSKSPGDVAVPLVGVKRTVTIPSLPPVLITVIGVVVVPFSLTE